MARSEEFDAPLANRRNRELNIRHSATVPCSLRLAPSTRRSPQREVVRDPKAFQDCYPKGLSDRDGDETVAVFHPQPYHTAIPGCVYGGLLASIIDCQGTGTAAAAECRAEQRELESPPPLRFLTAALHVNYLRPTPRGVPLGVRWPDCGPRADCSPFCAQRIV